MAKMWTERPHPDRWLASERRLEEHDAREVAVECYALMVSALSCSENHRKIEYHGWQATSDLPVLPAQRRGEAASARWKDIDGGAKLWVLSKTKSGHGHEVPLTALAFDVLQPCPARESMSSRRTPTKT